MNAPIAGVGAPPTFATCTSRYICSLMTETAPSRSKGWGAAGSGYGSCPYIYAMDAGEREWVRHGKVIDNVSSPAKETTARLELAGAVTRFKISEEELELTFVHKVRPNSR